MREEVRQSARAPGLLLPFLGRNHNGRFPTVLGDDLWPLRVDLIEKFAEPRLRLGDRPGAGSAGRSPIGLPGWRMGLDTERVRSPILDRVLGDACVQHFPGGCVSTAKPS